MYWTRQFRWIIFLLFILLLCVICAGVREGLQAPLAQAQQEYRSVNQIRGKITSSPTLLSAVQIIFLNNLRIFWVSAVPAIGWALGLTGWFLSGKIIGNEFQVEHLTSPLDVLILNPYVYSEGLCLSLFIGESIYLVALAEQDLSKAKERLLKYTWLTLLAGSALTYVSAYAETLGVRGNPEQGLILLGMFLTACVIFAKLEAGYRKSRNQ